MNVVPFFKSPLWLAVAAVVAGHAAAQSTPMLMDQITVSATRSERTVDEVASSVSVLTSEDAEQNLARNIRDLVKYQPGVTVSSDSRFGLGSFNIRGMEENRVKISVDGVSQAKSYGYDRSLQSQRNFVDIESIKQLEIVKGPASAMHGSDAIGGVAAFITKDPADFLKAQGDDTYLSIKTGYNSSDSSVSSTITTANRTGNVESMLLYTRRDGKEQETYGGLNTIGLDREEADPLDYSSNNVLGKVQYQIDELNRIGFTAEWMEMRSQSDLHSRHGETIIEGEAPITFHRIYEDQKSDDRSERLRIGLFHEYENSTLMFDDLKWSVNWQESSSDQITHDHFIGKPMGAFVTTDKNRIKTYQYFEDSLQLESIFNKSAQFLGSENLITYGVNAEYKTYENHNLTVGYDNKNNAPLAPEVTAWMPQVDFYQLGLFVQDELSVLNDRLVLTPALRYDFYAEDIEANNNYGSTSTLSNDNYNSFTGRLGAVFEINDTWSTFGQFSQGFTAPDMFSKYFNYKMGEHVTVHANPDLKPEESNSFELGLRANSDLGAMELTAFFSDYKNFIEETCVGTEACSAVGGDFQYQNLSDAHITGVEFKSVLFMDSMLSSLEGARINTAIAWAHGRGTKMASQGVQVSNEPLNTIAPLTAVIGFGYDAPSDIWGSELTWTIVAGKNHDDISNINDISMGGDQGAEKFAPAGYGLLDLTAYYEPINGLTFNAGLFNLTDKKYWIWDDVRNITVENQGIGRYTQPGRNFSASVKWEI